MKIFSNLGNLGDNLWLTPLILSLDAPKMVMYDHPHVRNISEIFRNLCEVEFQPNVSSYNIPHKEHKTLELSKLLNIELKTFLPQIILDKEEIDWARQFLSKYDNPIAVTNNNMGDLDKTNFCAQYRCPPKIIMESICSKIKKKYTLLQFGPEKGYFLEDFDHLTPIIDAVVIRGLPVRKVAACYYIIGKYIGGDTGDYHLMTAVGGKSHVLVPDHNPRAGYNYNHLHYPYFFWKYEENRVKYYNFREYQKIIEEI